MFVSTFKCDPKDNSKPEKDSNEKAKTALVVRN